MPCPCEVLKQHLYNLLCLLSLQSHAMSKIFLISPCFVSLILYPMVPLQNVALSCLGVRLSSLWNFIESGVFWAVHLHLITSLTSDSNWFLQNYQWGLLGYFMFYAWNAFRRPQHTCSYTTPLSFMHACFACSGLYSEKHSCRICCFSFLLFFSSLRRYF